MLTCFESVIASHFCTLW